MSRQTFHSILLAAMLLMGGCVASTPQVGGTVYERLQNDNPAVRIQAAVEAGNRGDEKAIPLLVDRLNDPNADVQFFAGLALKRIVGDEQYEQLGWQYYQSQSERDEAVQRWRDWLAGREPTATTRPTG
jgi:HEAT repeat protein